MSTSSRLEKCLMKGSRLKALFQEQGESRKFKERTFKTNDVDELIAQGVTLQALCDLLMQKTLPVVWMGTDSFVRYPPPYYRRRPLTTAPEGFKRLIDIRLTMNMFDMIELRVYGRESSTESYASLLNLLFHLVSLDERIKSVDLRTSYIPFPDPNRLTLPAPPSALHRLVHHARSPREVLFLDLSITEEQGRALFFQCSPHVRLNDIRIPLLHDRGKSLFDSLASNQSPSILSIYRTAVLSDEAYGNFVSGLKGNTTLKTLKLPGYGDDDSISPERMRLFLKAFDENLGIESLNVSNQRNALTSDENWDALWKAASHHPSIKTLDFPDIPNLPEQKKIDRTKSIIRALEMNHNITSVSRFVGLDTELMQKSVIPLLEVNRFRPRIQAIFQERDQNLRWKLLGRALQRRSLQNNPTVRYLLLFKNADLLQSHAPTRVDRLTIRWNKFMDRQRSHDDEFKTRQLLLDKEREALENEMRQLGMSIPSPTPPASDTTTTTTLGVDDDKISPENDNDNKRQRTS